MDAADKLLLLTAVSVIAFKSSKHQFSVITKYKMKRKESRSKAPIHGTGEVGRGKQILLISSIPFCILVQMLLEML